MSAESGARRRSRAVFFDWYGTLVPLGPLETACETAAPGHGADLATRWRARQLEASWLRTIMGRWADFDRITQDALATALAETRVDVETTQQADLVETFINLPARTDAGHMLQQLRGQGVVVGVLSNGTRRTLERGIVASGLDIDHVLSADDAQAFKPHPSLYQLAVDATTLPPTEIGFVTGNGWDAAGAAAFGFDVLWLKADASAQLPAVGSSQPVVGSWRDVLRRFATPSA